MYLPHYKICLSKAFYLSNLAGQRVLDPIIRSPIHTRCRTKNSVVHNKCVYVVKCLFTIMYVSKFPTHEVSPIYNSTTNMLFYIR